MRKYKVENILISDLRTPAYGREVSAKKVNDIVENFDMRKLQPIVVSRREGGRYIIDGNHRVTACKHKGIKFIAAMVLEGLTYEQESKLYVELNTSQRRLNTRDVFIGRIEAKDQDALDIQTTLKDAGFEIGASQTYKSLTCVGAVEYVVDQYGHSVLTKTLETIRDAWFYWSNGYSQQFVKGIALFIHLYREQLDMKRLVKVLSKNSPDWHYSAAKNDIEKIPMDRKMARVILKKYNERISIKLPDLI